MEYTRACDVFCCQKQNRAIVASVFNHGGLYAEKPDGVTGCELANMVELGTLLKDALNKCEYKEEFNYRDNKPKDWPAFQFSGYKTVRQFEKDFARFFVCGVNDKNFIYNIDSPELNPLGKVGLRLQATVNGNGPPAEFGNAIGLLLQFYQANIKYIRSTILGLNSEKSA